MSKRKWKKSINTFLTASLAASIVVPAAYSSPVKAISGPQDVLISEYIEGSSFNKAIELYNGTGSDIDLSNYSLELYSNGAVSPSQTLKLSSTLKNGETYVLYHKDANADIKSKGDLANTTVINFNGDDAVVLKKNGTVIDSIGQAGARVENLKDVTLVRNPDHVTGDTNIRDAFDPTKGWKSLPNNDSSNLGFRSTVMKMKHCIASAEEGLFKGTKVTLTQYTWSDHLLYNRWYRTNHFQMYHEPIEINENTT